MAQQKALATAKAFYFFHHIIKLLTKYLGILRLCSRDILGRGIFIADEGIGRVDEVSEVGIVESLTLEGLTGGVYILAAYLEEAVILTKLHKSLKLGEGISCRHICDGVKFKIVKDFNE